MVSHQPAKFGGQRHRGSAEMFLVVGERNSTCFRLNPSLLFISTAYEMPYFNT